jgi:hypothetical protein
MADGHTFDDGLTDEEHELAEAVADGVSVPLEFSASSTGRPFIITTESTTTPFNFWENVAESGIRVVGTHHIDGVNYFHVDRTD